MSSTLKLCMPHVSGRGAGLGNELIPWARSVVAGATLGVKVLPPAFGFNHRKYWRHFGTPRYDWLAHRAIEALLPRIDFTEADFYESEGNLTESIKIFSAKHRLDEREAWVITTQGMWGGYRHLIEAREHIKSTLYLSKFAFKNLLKINSRLNPDYITVGMHIRLGDFTSSSNIEDYKGKFNKSLPLQWYINIAKSLQAQLNDKVQFLIVTDGNLDQLKPLLDVCNAVTTIDIPDSDVSDMLALANSDLIVCSVSSYSAWAAFLSESPYLWFEPNLQKINGYYSIWGHEKGQKKENSFTNRNVKSSKLSNEAYSKGAPVPLNGILPINLGEQLLKSKMKKCMRQDLVNYGVVHIK
ncbi:hypothetical protein RGQ13_13775 [Thalassotalea psychrophila]|uniref:Glycosyl transferase family 11 n=1 Tax=Thalassotalea psychrophila TaxID=3065647 RepID=A0ABY9TR33_9GAMM|nr:hypothetical protein RGQ13_13775 [Colwelliaceae bacterium SQ149]